MKSIIGYKGFDKDFKCQGFQYGLGSEFEESKAPVMCENGFHFCELPISVLSYYPLKDGNQYAIIEARGKVITEDDKSATDKIFVKSKIDIAGMVKASIDIIWNKAKKVGIFKKGSATSGNRANSATSGYGAHSATYMSDAIACAVGRKAKAKASIGCFIVLAEWKEGKEFTDAKPIGVISAKVDGKKIKADTWYKSVNGKFVETDDSND